MTVTAKVICWRPEPPTLSTHTKKHGTLLGFVIYRLRKSWNRQMPTSSLQEISESTPEIMTPKMNKSCLKEGVVPKSNWRLWIRMWFGAAFKFPSDLRLCFGDSELNLTKGFVNFKMVSSCHLELAFDLYFFVRGQLRNIPFPIIRMTVKSPFFPFSRCWHCCINRLRLIISIYRIK